MRARGMMAARAKASQTAQVAEAKGLERRRGLISFLTWAFFLAEVFGRDGIAPASAHAAEPDEPAPGHGHTDVAPMVSDLSDRPMTGIDDPGEPTTTISPGYTLNLQTVGREAAPLDVGDKGSQDAPAAHTLALPIGAGEAAASGAPSAAPDASAQIGSETAEPVSLLHATIAPDGLLHGVADTLSELPLIGNLLGNTVHAVASTVEDLVGGLLSPRRSDAAGDAVLASNGFIAFEPSPSTAPYHELETPHGFTDYGIALELSLPGSSVLSLAPPSEPDVVNFSTDHDASHISVSTDHGLPDDGGQRSSSDVLA